MQGFAAQVFHCHLPLDHEVRRTCGIDDKKLKALLCEISEEWLTGKIYLNMKPADLPQK